MTWSKELFRLVSFQVESLEEPDSEPLAWNTRRATTREGSIIAAAATSFKLREAIFNRSSSRKDTLSRTC